MGRVKKAVKKAKKAINWKKIRWGSLTRWLEKHENEIQKLTGHKAFTRSGEINDNTLRILAAHPEYVKKISKSHWKKIMRKIKFKLRVLRG